MKILQTGFTNKLARMLSYYELIFFAPTKISWYPIVNQNLPHDDSALTRATGFLHLSCKSVTLFIAILAATGTMVVGGCTPAETVSYTPEQSTHTEQSADSIQAGYKIRIGDRIELSVWGYPEFQTSATVKEAGTITLPLAGDETAVGLTKQQLIDETRKKLTEFIHGKPEITVSIVDPSALKISVLGAVTKQDSYPVTGEVTLLEVISIAGGTTAESDLARIKIIHKGSFRPATEVDLESSIKMGTMANVPMVIPGDVVFVPKRENVVREFSGFLQDAVLLFGIFRIFY